MKAVVICVTLLVAVCVNALPAAAPGATQQPQEYVRYTVDQTRCINMCSGRGHCVENNSPGAPPSNTTICICDQGWTGDDCSSVILPNGQRDEGDDCPNHCSSRGICHRGSSVVRPRCYCDSHYTGVDCSKLRDFAIMCPKNCSGFGLCTEGYSDQHGAVIATCMCDRNHAGEDCSVEVIATCPHDCSGNGDCTPRGCACHPGFIGTDCSLRDIPSCPNNCSSLGRCLQGQCYCNVGYEGIDCSVVPKITCPRNCSNHGRCVANTKYFPGGCACEKDWLGSDCSIPKLKSVGCPNNCSSRGFCYGNGTCLCESGYVGDACEFTVSIKNTIPENLVAEGDALHPYYMDSKILKPSPSDRTRVVMSDEHPLCPGNCSSHGVCEEIISDTLALYHPNGQRIDGEGLKLPTPMKQFICRCDPGYSGPDCSIAPNKNLGSTAVAVVETPAAPVEGTSQTTSLFAEDPTQWNKLPNSNQLKIKSMGCPNNCSSRGRCLRDDNGYPFCSCYTTWTGNDCSVKVPNKFHCPLVCSNHGKCVTASEYFPVHCMCDAGWHGENCEKPNPIKIVYEYTEPGLCPNHCSGRGICVDGKCVCTEIGYGGPDCSVQSGGTCEANCNGNGICFWGLCECLGGYSGGLCDIEPKAPCPNNCNGKGKCVGGQCICLTGFTGDDCSDVLIECPRHCSGHGDCIPAEPKLMRPARCECNEGFTGADCSNFPKGLEIDPIANSTAAQKINEMNKAAQELEKAPLMKRMAAKQANHP